MVEEKKIPDNARSFEGADGLTYHILAPSANDIREADWQYSKVYTRSLTEGITTSAEMMDILRRRSIVGSEFEQRAIELTRILNQKILQLQTAENIDQKRELAIEVAQARDELFQWNQRLNGPMSNTCENLADDARLEYLTSCMVVNSDAERIWKDYDSYLKERSNSKALRARYEVMLYLQGLESDFLEKTPEAQAMKDVERELLKRAEEAALALKAIEEENKQTSDITEEVVTEEAPKPKKARKKKSE